jgi:peptidoglycan-associated lipoprotein
MRTLTKGIAVFALSIAVLATPACRRKKPLDPAPLPPVVTETAEPAQPSTRVDPPTEFQPEKPEPVVEELSADIAEANRQARERGYIRDAFFGYDEAALDDEAQAALTTSAKWLREHPEYRIRIEGHCDERGTEQYNLALGDRRAGAASAYLETLGIDRGRIELVSYGEQRPFEEGSSEDVFAQNRRAHIVLTGRR